MVRESNSRSIIGDGRRRRHTARRDLILEAAGRVFRRRGFADTGMRDIAEAADLSAANLYHYFPSKDAILFYCQDRALDRMLAAVTAARAASTRSSDRLRQVLTAHIRVMLDEVEGATAHLEVDALSPALRERIIRKRDRYERALRRILADGMASGEFVRMRPAAIARAMLGALNWTATWFRHDGPETVDAVGETISAFLLRGVASRSTTTAPPLTLVGGTNRRRR